MKEFPKNATINIWSFILTTAFFFQLGLANNTADSILLSIHNATPEEKITIWDNWINNPTKDNIIPLWKNVGQAYADAKEVLGPENANTWHFKFLGTLVIKLQSAGHGDISTTILDQMKSTADSLATIKGTPHNLQGQYYYYMGYFHYKQVDMDEAEALFLQGLKISQEVGDFKLEFGFYNMLGLLKTFIDEEEEALFYYAKASEITKKAIIPNNQKLVLYKSMAYLYHETDEYQKASELYQIVMDSIHLISSKSVRWRLQMDYAVNLGYLGRVAESIMQLDELRPKIEEEENNSTLVVLSESYTEVLMLAGRYKEAAEWLGNSRAYYYKVQEARRKDEVQEWQAKYQSAEKEATISGLEQQRTISRSRSIIGALTALTLIVFLCFFLYANYSRRKRLRLQLDNEREVNSIRSKFFASIAHDIRTPLALILAPLERLESTVNDATNKADIQLARRNGIRLMDLFNQILDWNKADAKLLKHNPQVGHLGMAFSRLCERFEQLAVEKGVKFTQHINVPEAHFLLDYGKMDRVVSNLLDNAIKYCDVGDGVILSVELEDESKTLRIVVSDDGPGIGEEEQTQIFKRYFQGNQGKIKGGSGIGLALVQELVDIMNGNIMISSELNKGSTFIVKLPVEPADQTNQQLAPLAFGGNVLRTDASILIIEDEPELAAFLTSDLSGRFNVLTANTAAAGLSIAANNIPDIIISDWMLPDYDGGQLCRQLIDNELTAHIPIIVLTAYNTDEHQKEALDSGAVVWMSKPFQMSKLNRQIDTILKHQQRNQEKWNSSLVSITDESNNTKNRVDPLVEKIQKVISEHYTDENFSMNRMAEILAISRVQLFRKVKNTIGNTPGKMLNEFRLQKAKQLLRSSDLSVSEICFQVGFSDPGYFSKLYKKRFEISPSQEISAG